MKEVRISIIIVTYNSLGLIKDCLKSIYDYDDIHGAFEVIVVDNKSQDYSELVQYINEQYPLVKIIRNEKNGGYGQGNNLGITNASGDVILIMNPDVRCKEPIFQNALQQLDNSNIVLLGMKQWSSYKNRGTSYRYDAPYSSPLLNIFRDKIYNNLNYFNPERMYLVGACFFVKKQHFTNIGSFDDQIFMYNEESDIRNRIIAKYGKSSIAYNKRMNFIHLSEGRNFSYRNDKNSIISYVYYLKKYSYNIRIALKRKLLSRRFFLFVSYLKNDNISCEEYRKAIKFIQVQISLFG